MSTSTLEHVDPRTLILEDNSRVTDDIARQRPQLVASIAKHGVQTPITANRTADGQLRVRHGYNRALAAAQAVNTYPTVKVVVTDDDENQAARLVDQMVENNIREGYTEAEQARNLERLSLFGLTTEQITNQTSLDRDTVAAGLTVRRSTRAAEVLDNNPQLDLLQTAVLAEFADDDAAFADLQETLEDEPDQFDHVAARWRRSQAERQARAELAETLRADGLAVLEDAGLPAGTAPLWRLQRSRADTTRLDADPDAHADCPGHAARILTSPTGQARVNYVCRDWASHGHHDPTTVTSSTSTTGGTGKKTEREKVALRRVKANNTAWRAAREVRCQWLRKLLRRKTPPKQAQQFVAAALAAGDPELRKAMDASHRDACHLLELPEPSRQQHPLAPTSKATANQAIMLQLSMVLAAFEAATDVHTWRSPTAAHQRYFTALADWGYTLSPVEQLVCDSQADAADWPELQDHDPSSSDTSVDEDVDSTEDADDLADLADEVDDELDPDAAARAQPLAA